MVLEHCDLMCRRKLSPRDDPVPAQMQLCHCSCCFSKVAGQGVAGLDLDLWIPFKFCGPVALPASSSSPSHVVGMGIRGDLVSYIW